MHLIDVFFRDKVYLDCSQKFFGHLYQYVFFFFLNGYFKVAVLLVFAMLSKKLYFTEGISVYLVKKPRAF